MTEEETNDGNYHLSKGRPKIQAPIQHEKLPEQSLPEDINVNVNDNNNDLNNRNRRQRNQSSPGFSSLSYWMCRLERLDATYDQLNHEESELKAILRELQQEQSCLENANHVAVFNPTQTTTTAKRGGTTTVGAATSHKAFQQSTGSKTTATSRSEEQTLQRLHQALFTMDEDSSEEDDD